MQWSVLQKKFSQLYFFHSMFLVYHRMRTQPRKSGWPISIDEWLIFSFIYIFHVFTSVFNEQYVEFQAVQHIVLLWMFWSCLAGLYRLFFQRGRDTFLNVSSFLIWKLCIIQRKLKDARVQTPSQGFHVVPILFS